MSDPKLKNLQPKGQTSGALSGTPSNNQAIAGLPTDRCPKAPGAEKPALGKQLKGMGESQRHKPAAWTCQQHLWISIFFDGTGNNLKADLPTLEHSNVARMFRAHKPESEADGIYRIYVPGIGTLFPDIGDPGKGKIIDTHNAMGAKGQDRLDWAYNEMKKIVKLAEARAQNPTNKIVMINVAVFGFSRGATLARAFIRDLLKPELGRTRINGNKLTWLPGDYPMEIRFMGLWDTVASVGATMSVNNMVDAARSARGSVADGVRKAVIRAVTLQMGDAPALRAVDLAFRKSGADPAPGKADGHADWANGLEIPEIVKQCVHMVAGHELRNSFPLDSVLRGQTKPHNCLEIVYPGMHSNVGGGYRPGEGGRGAATPADKSNPNADALLSLLPLRAMYDQALASGVPLRKIGTNEWKDDNIADFTLSARLGDLFDHYMKYVGTGGRPLGEEFLAHTRAYFAWRWWRIKHGRGGDAAANQRNEKVFAADRDRLDREMNALKDKKEQQQRAYDAADRERNAAAVNYQRGKAADPAKLAQQLKPYEDRMAAATAEMKRLQGQIDELRARKETLPSIGTLTANLNKFDRALVEDVKSIIEYIDENKGKNLQKRLRPHYRNLVETYLAEERGQGLRDELVCAFFDNHVNDSLADFDMDATLPSDPRVIYIGSDIKLPFAQAEPAEEPQTAHG